MIAVSDSTPLIALASVGRLDLLRALFGAVLIPEAVRREVVEVDADRPGAAEVLAAAWIRTSHVHDAELVALLSERLDPGEAEAIALAVERGAALVLLDERLGRQQARDQGLEVTGTLGLLVSAKERGHLKAVRPVLEALEATHFYVSKALRRHILTLCGEA